MSDRPGFANPVLDAQAAFRAVLGAMARPGSLHSAGEGLDPPRPLGSATGAVLLALIDQETPVWLDPAAAPARDWLAFHCGARFTSLAEAAFAVGLSLPNLSLLSHGTHEAPEQGATVIVQVARIGAGTKLRLRGPGLAQSETLAIEGLPPGFAARWRASQAEFPLGVDLILCAGITLVALPRSVSVEEV